MDFAFILSVSMTVYVTLTAIILMPDLVILAVH